VKLALHIEVDDTDHDCCGDNCPFIGYGDNCILYNKPLSRECGDELKRCDVCISVGYSLNEVI
jgi:hypothetical protein